MYQKSQTTESGRKRGGFGSSRGSQKRRNIITAGSAGRKGFFGFSENGNSTNFSDRRNSSSSEFRKQRPKNQGQKNGKIKVFNDHTKFIKKASPVSQTEEYVAKNKFSDFDLADYLKKNIELKGYTSPTPIQDQAIPYLVSGRDVIGLADTGTGKTGAFIIPLIDKVYKNPRERVIIVAPTRELASQIDQELKEFSRGMRIFSTQIIGGANMSRQIRELYRDPQFVIGTPGRICDLIKRGKLKLAGFGNIVLDEVDRMLDMGFINDIKIVLSELPEKRQSLFFSATISPNISSLIKTFQNNPVTISVKSQTSSENIDQDIVKVDQSQQKIEVLHSLLNKEDFKKVLIFGRTKRGVEKLSNELSDRGFRSTSIHGDKPQSKREKALRLFKQDELNILVATDVAARGLDIDDVTHVINYELPETYDDYVHRIGRTGRANKKGTALTFVS